MAKRSRAFTPVDAASFAELVGAPPADLPGFVKPDELRPRAIVAESTRAEFAATIGRLWTKTQEHFLAVGRYLIAAKERLPHGEFLPMIEQDLPFTRSTAFKLMKVAAYVDGNPPALERLPSSYEVIYHVTTLSDEERARALSVGVLHPGARQADLIAFKRDVRSAHADRRRKLLEEKRRLLQRLVEVRRALQEL